MADINKKFKLEITIDDGKVTSVVNKTVESVNRLTNATNQQAAAEQRASKIKKGSIADYEQQIRVLQKEIKNESISTKVIADKIAKISNLNGKIVKLTGGYSNLSKVNENLIGNTGLAGATITEFGRTISDLPYGIQGVANNLSQLTTLFNTFVSKTKGGIIPAISQLGKALNGPLGIVLAVQAVIAAWDFFAKKQREAGDSVKALSQELLDQTTIVRDLLDAFEQTPYNIDKRLQIIKAIAVYDKDLAKSLEKSILDEEKLNRIKEARAKLTETSIEVEKINKKFQEEIEDNEERRNELIGDRNELLELQRRITNLHSSDIKELGEINAELITIEERGKEISDEKRKIIVKQQEALDQYNKILGKTQEAEEVNISLLKEKLDLVQSEEAVDEESALKKIDNIKNLNLGILKLEEDVALKKAKKEEYSEAKVQAIRDKYDLKRKRLENDTNSEIIRIKREYFGESIDISDKANKTTYQLDEEAAKERIKLAKWARNELKKINEGKSDEFAEFAASRGFDGKVDKPKTPEQIAKEQEKRRKQNIELAKESIAQIQDLFNAAYDAEISREEAKTAKLNNELKKRLQNENLTAKQREQLNLQIASNEEKLQEKRDKLAEKQFKLQKAISIGQALINTYEMASRAYNAVLAGPEKFLGISALALAKVAAGITTAFGLAQVNAIRKQQFVPSAIATPSLASGSTSAPSVQAPDFNIVGASNRNQLAEAINDKLSKPIEAFVVSKNITTAQELDRNKISSASL